MKFLITGAVTYSQDFYNALKKMGHKYIFVQDERIPLREQNIEPDEIEGIICNGLFLYNDIENFNKLKYIQLTSAGTDRVPIEYISAHNIELHNASGVYSIPMAEWAVSYVLTLYKKMIQFQKKQEIHLWEKERDIYELFGKNVLIVGAGNVGTEVAKRFSAFDTNIIGIDKVKGENPFMEKVEPLDRLDELLKISDVVVLTIPLTNETYHLISRDKMQFMKSNAIIINISRGKVIDENALLEYLNRGKFFGAGLDVFEEEPLQQDDKLWDIERAVITPHNSFVGEGNQARLEKVILKNVRGISKE